MSLEIERKFLVKGDFKPFVACTVNIVQAYLCVSEQMTVRVRIKGDKAFVTIKGASDANGFSRHEFEYGIPVTDAEELLQMSPYPAIEKERHLVPCKNHIFEIDVFHGINEGVVLAELELQSENEAYEKPAWLGEEVTGDKRYYNAFMAVQSASRS
ncbi:MAG: CYTH domain-containing protein [Dysgonamonadaceae bacterium]|jgi:CYTH domain-containing protein|nr:CYTH domain-containing protein [Dysgonamonadaceae bacterium]